MVFKLYTFNVIVSPVQVKEYCPTAFSPRVFLKQTIALRLLDLLSTDSGQSAIGLVSVVNLKLLSLLDFCFLLAQLRF